MLMKLSTSMWPSIYLQVKFFSLFRVLGLGVDRRRRDRGQSTSATEVHRIYATKRQFCTRSSLDGTTDFPGSIREKSPRKRLNIRLPISLPFLQALPTVPFLEMGIPESKLCKIPYGVDMRRFSKVTDPATDCFDVLFVGQVSFRKGVPDLIDAFGLLKHRRKRLRLVGVMRPEMKRYLKRNLLQGDVEFLGISQVQLKHIMSRSHVMVLPSIQDGFGLVLAQALACGCPVIGTRHTGAEDLFSDGNEGFIVPIRNSRMILIGFSFLPTIHISGPL